MAISSEAPTLVTFRGGFVADWAVVAKLLQLEAKGATFEVLADGRIKVSPSGLLDDATRDFLRARRDEARAVIQYQAPEVPA
jgi:hypothetical protein